MLPDIPKKITLFEGGDDRAISPVLATAVLIAITLIFGAVIGGWVLNYGPSKLSATTPSVSLVKGDTEDNPSGDYILINHNSGPKVSADDVRIIIKDMQGTTLMTFESQSGDEIGAGDTIKINSTSSETTVRWGQSNSAYSAKNTTFDLGSEPVRVVFIHTESQAKVGEVTARA